MNNYDTGEGWPPPPPRHPSPFKNFIYSVNSIFRMVSDAVEKKIVEEIEKGYGSRDFEDELALDFSTDGARTSVKSEWIKNHLVNEDSDYPRRMWIRFLAFTIYQDIDVKTGGYSNFNNHLYRLRELDLIKRTTRVRPTGEVGNPEWGRAFYTVVADNLGNIAWQNPTGVLYPYSWRKWIANRIDEGLSPDEIAKKAEELSPKDISVSAEQIRNRIETWNLLD